MIRNISKNDVVVGEHEVCDNPFSRARGLMFRRKLEDKGLVFVLGKECVASIHMLFVFFSIDIIWLDKEKKVVDMREHVMPFTPHVRPSSRSCHFIELPAGTIKKKRIEKKDKIEW